MRVFRNSLLFPVILRLVPSPSLSRRLILCLWLARPLTCVRPVVLRSALGLSLIFIGVQYQKFHDVIQVCNYFFFDVLCPARSAACRICWTTIHG
jgi:hypothetical protein